jgi:hypothetical protein
LLFSGTAITERQKKMKTQNTPDPAPGTSTAEITEKRGCAKHWKSSTMFGKELKPLKLETPEKFKSFLNVLWDELYWADFYCDIFKEVSRLCNEHKKAVNFSPHFWSFTMRAHCQTALVYLHRIYDQNKDSFNIHRFLLTVREHREIFNSTSVCKRRENDPHADCLIRAIGTLDPVQLDRDVEFSSNANPKVLNLNTWRDKVTFHKDEGELFRQKPFEDEHPLPFTDIDELLEGGFQILNRYSQYFDTQKYNRNNCREWKDMKFVFEALMHHPDVIRM